VPPGHPDAAELRAAALAELPGAPGRVLALEGADDDDLAAVLAGAAALCLPSHAEGFGLPALEAMASGTPVVVSDRGALPEVVGDAGLVVEPAAEALEDALARVLEDAALAARLSAAGRERALGMSWARTAEGWLDVLAGAAGRRR
jgi:alpha-1,3-rhamnosyl/mannosyltransferase